MKERINVCIVDDDDIYQYTMTLNLKYIDSVGKIRIFNDGSEAIDFISDKQNDRQELPDIIFLDINMPVMDGFQFLEEYAKLKSTIDKKITIYMVSSSIDPADIEKATQIGEVSDYIVKPLTQDQLEKILQNLEQN